MFAIREPLHFEDVISYLFLSDKEAALIDTGMGFFNINDIISDLTDLPITVLNTHSHSDHVGSNSEFDKVYGWEHDVSLKRSANTTLDPLFLELKDKKMFPDEITASEIEGWFIKPYSFIALNETNSLTIGDLKFKIIHSPGHSPDGICFYETNSKTLIAGDNLYMGPIFLQLEESNLKDYIESLKNLNDLDINLILGGHNEAFFDKTYINEIID
ncbi:MAG: MBL fold metallo-hydrolase [Candidatus Dojkabacteria bacterium]|nr:MBL fold metallo-hydrolase [Candidatus Dojkabacteria bacterium]MDQ7020669.1 MBL fold metallo-hydrolase [Candidatus Dojkabacteria bacterium]